MTRSDEVTNKFLSRALGEELRRQREARGWSRGSLAAQLPSGIGERTLLSYEHGTRHLTVVRLIELCQALGLPASEAMQRAAQRAEIYLATQPLRVDLRHLLRSDNVAFRPLHMWARNRLKETPNGVAEITPAAVRELAASIGREAEELSAYLARFLPDEDAHFISEEVSGSH